MQRKRTSQQQYRDADPMHASTREGHGAVESMQGASTHPFREELDGQLGPDELPDAAEVLRSREAKLHK